MDNIIDIKLRVNNAICMLQAELRSLAHNQASNGMLNEVHYLVAEERKLFSIERRIGGMF